MKLSFKLLSFVLFLTAFTPLLFSQSIKAVSAGEITFNDAVLSKEFNKVYLLQPGEFVTVKNLSASGEIAIGSKNYFDISNKLALTYQSHDSLSLKIILQYEKIDSKIKTLNSGLTIISDDLQKINLTPSISLLEKSNATLENSNKELDSAVAKLNEINSDLTGVQFANLWSILAAGIIGFITGSLVFK
jgi:hypothetical protein